MPSIWKKDRIPDNNTVRFEVARLKRIATALELAILEKRYKHVYRDIDELHRSIDELERLTHGDSNENTEY